MSFFKQKTRSRFNNTEFTAKRLPVHPVSRYSTFSSIWKKTRKLDGHIPRPINNGEDFFPCCHICQVRTRSTDRAANEPLWRKTANVEWLRAEWFWDFGHLLPEGFIDYGVGVTSPTLQLERDRLFVFDPTDSEAIRHYVDVDLAVHAQIGAHQHEAKVRISEYPYSELVVFEGQLLCSLDGYLFFPVPRTSWLGDGKEIWQRFIFVSTEMAYDINLVVNGDNIVANGEKVSFMGIQL